MITTYRAKRRQKVGPRRWREPGELLPELHLSRTAYSSLVTGYAAEVQIEAEEFVAELSELDLDADIEQRVLNALGLGVSDKGEVVRDTTDTTKHPRRTLVGVDKDVEHRIGGPAQPMRRPPATKRAARKKAPRKATVVPPAEKLVKHVTAEGEPDIPLRTLD